VALGAGEASGADDDLAGAGARRRVSAFVRAALGASAVDIVAAAPLRGGAIQENWAVDLEIAGGPRAGRHGLVLRRDAASKVGESLGRAEEYALLRVAAAAGVTVPEPWLLCTDLGVLGRDFYLMRRLPGVAAGHRLVRDMALGGPRDALAERLGEELARLHRVTPSTLARFLGPGTPPLDFLRIPEPSAALDQVARYRAALDAMGEVRPALEWGLRWLERHAPPAGELVLVHQDFRTGNYLVDGAGLVAILDWEFGAWGDPMADIGWFCAKCWRFGAFDKEAGGIAGRAPFYRGYEAASGRQIDRGAVHYWEIMAHLRWAVVALQQADRFIRQGDPSLELALTGRIPAELEWEILALIEARR
jgi:aminoglycoside phosphotransferase (APT) family kinase protein